MLSILSVERNPWLLCFCYTSLFDWSRKLGRPSQPIRYKIKTNHDLIPRVFPRFRQFGCHYFEFSLAITGILLSSDWPLLFITLVVVFRQLTSDPVLMTNNGSSPNQGNFLLILILNQNLNLTCQKMKISWIREG